MVLLEPHWPPVNADLRQRCEALAKRNDVRIAADRNGLSVSPHRARTGTDPLQVELRFKLDVQQAFTYTSPYSDIESECRSAGLAG
jgi:hypothetical protein